MKKEIKKYKITLVCDEYDMELAAKYSGHTKPTKEQLRRFVDIFVSKAFNAIKHGDKYIEVD